MNMPGRWEQYLDGLDDGGQDTEQVFTQAVLQHFDRQRRRRLGLICAACLLAVIVAATVALFAPGAEVRIDFGDLRDILAALILTALCGMVWIATDAGDIPA